MTATDLAKRAPSWSYAGLVQEKAATHGERIFARFADRDVAYVDLDRRSNSVGNGLRSLGLAPGEKVAVLLPNTPEFLDVWFATEKIGAVMVPVNISLKGEGLKYIIAHSDSVAVVVHDECVDQFLAIRDGLPAV